jgi:hypothetical protein
MFEVDVETMLPVKVLTYSLDLQGASPAWKYDHEMTSLYEMTDLSPKAFADLSERFFRNETLAVSYINAKTQHGPQSLTSECNLDCRREQYCQTMNSVYLEVL